MKRFLGLLAVAALSAVIYVTAAPGGLQATGPTARQFAALKKEVGRLQKQVTAARKEADASLGVLGLCIMHKPVSVDQVGSSTSGYLFGAPQTAPNAVTATASSALDLSPSTETSPQYEFFALNTSQQACVTLASTLRTMTARRSVAAFAGGR
jgi:hypothetical protein